MKTKVKYKRKSVSLSRIVNEAKKYLIGNQARYDSSQETVYSCNAINLSAYFIANNLNWQPGLYTKFQDKVTKLLEEVGISNVMPFNDWNHEVRYIERMMWLDILARYARDNDYRVYFKEPEFDDVPY